MGKPRPREQRHANARTINAVIARLNDTLAQVSLQHAWPRAHHVAGG